MKALLPAVLLLVIASAAASADIKTLERNQWPTSVNAAVVDLLAGLSDEDKASLREMRKEDLIRLHHGWGTGIRNQYGLWRGNRSLIESACGKPCHPDEASMIIIEAVWAAVQRDD